MLDVGFGSHVAPSFTISQTGCVQLKLVERWILMALMSGQLIKNTNTIYCKFMSH